MAAPERAAEVAQRASREAEVVVEVVGLQSSLGRNGKAREDMVRKLKIFSQNHSFHFSENLKVAMFLKFSFTATFQADNF